MIVWFIQNQEWLFSGVAVAIPIALAGWLVSIKKNRTGGDKYGVTELGDKLVMLVSLITRNTGAYTPFNDCETFRYELRVERIENNRDSGRLIFYPTSSYDKEKDPIEKKYGYQYMDMELPKKNVLTWRYHFHDGEVGSLQVLDLPVVREILVPKNCSLELNVGLAKFLLGSVVFISVSDLNDSNAVMYDLAPWIEKFNKNYPISSSLQKKVESYLHIGEEVDKCFCFIKENFVFRKMILLITTQRFVLLTVDCLGRCQDLSDNSLRQLVSLHLDEGVFFSSISLHFFRYDYFTGSLVGTTDGNNIRCIDHWHLSRIKRKQARNIYKILKWLECKRKETCLT